MSHKETSADRIISIIEKATCVDPPARDVVEVNLFGPGYGESVAVHLGSAKWLVVDSCAPDDEAEPAALTYLRQIGVNYEHDVKYIVATHWHDDHIRGLSQLITSCRAADVFISDALRYEALMRLVLARAPRHVTNLREMNRTVKTLLARKPEVSQPYRFLLEDTAVHSAQHHPSNDVEIWALSPSSVDVRQALRGLRNILPSESGHLSTVANPRENHASIVLHVRVGNQYILLGADRETNTNRGRGWDSVAACAARRALQPSTLLKVPHHGSANGHSLVIWRDLLESDCVAILAPFRRGRGGGRPRATDIARICSQTRWAFTTSHPANREKKLSPLPSAFSESKAMGFEQPEPAQLPLSHVRARARSEGGPWSIDLVDPAAHLCQSSDC
jgi:beta-lactamase superfamily II metal-dependent hydrolase